MVWGFLKGAFPLQGKLERRFENWLRFCLTRSSEHKLSSIFFLTILPFSSSCTPPVSCCTPPRWPNVEYSKIWWYVIKSFLTLRDYIDGSSKRIFEQKEKECLLSQWMVVEIKSNLIWEWTCLNSTICPSTRWCLCKAILLSLRTDGNSSSAVKPIDPKVPNLWKEVKKQFPEVIRSPRVL